MKKSAKVPKIDPYLEGMMGKLIDRLIVIEKKMDTLMSKMGNLNAGSPKPVPQPPKHDRTLYEAICADCHKICEVPFRPTEARPVYCKECWAKRKSGGKGPQLPVLTPVALPSKPKSQIVLPPLPAKEAAKRTKKNSPAKKAKKKK